MKKELLHQDGSCGGEGKCSTSKAPKRLVSCTSETMTFSREQVLRQLGPVIRQFRIHLELTQQDFAGKLSKLLEEQVPQSYVSRVESGSCEPSLSRLLAICETLEVNELELFRECRRHLWVADYVSRKGRFPPERIPKRGSA
jgi:transcriptional regulator with XRE-family HTH domain